jgi:hypothetical protein
MPYERVLSGLKPKNRDWNPLDWDDGADEELPFNPIQFPTRRN